MTFTTEEIDRLLNPTSVALVGASENSIWATTMHANLTKWGFPGAVHMVNPSRTEAFGKPAYPDLKSIPAPVDHALVVTPASTLPAILTDARDVGIKNVTVVASGFQEAGAEGLRLSQWVKEFCDENRIALIGPNCYGFSNFMSRAFLTRNSFDGIRPGGPIGMAFQSGGLNLATCHAAYARGVDLGFAISSGNELVVDTNDYYEYFLSRDDIRVIGGTLERIPDPERFAAITERARELRKPIVILKLGRSEEMQRLAVAHTGSVAGADVVVDTFLRELGVLRVDSLEELVDTAGLLAGHGWPQGDRTFFMSFTGGVCGLMADLAKPSGLNLDPLGSDLREAISSVSGIPGTSIYNPFDATTEGVPHLARILDAVVDSGDYDSVVLNGDEPRGPADTAITDPLLTQLARIQKRGLFTASFGGVQVEPTEFGISAARGYGVPYLHGAVGARALGNAIRYGKWLNAGPRSADNEVPTPPSIDLRDRRPGALAESESKELLQAYGIPVTKEAVATTPEQAVALATGLGFPVVLKIVSKDIPHKSEAGGVLIGLNDPASVTEGFASILANARAYAPDAAIDGVLVSEMIVDAAEFFVGVTSDPAIGPIVVAGLGGIYVEILRDTVTALPPVSHERAEALLLSLQSAPLLTGARGGPKRDISAFADVIVRVGQLALDQRGVVDEIDINPLFVLEQGKGVRAADGLIVIAERQSAHV
jgi:acetyltransferase